MSTYLALYSSITSLTIPATWWFSSPSCWQIKFTNFFLQEKLQVMLEQVQRHSPSLSWGSKRTCLKRGETPPPGQQCCSIPQCVLNAGKQCFSHNAFWDRIQHWIEISWCRKSMNKWRKTDENSFCQEEGDGLWVKCFICTVHLCRTNSRPAVDPQGSTCQYTD